MDVEQKIWGGECYSETVPYHVSIALQEIGGLVLGIYERESNRAIGVLVTIPAIINGKPAYYSHMHGYIEGYRGLGLGYIVKKIQAEYAKSKGIDLILWTYDPLLAPNAWFNIAKLGIIFRRYSPNHYGRMNVFYNRGVESDRVWAEWYIDSVRVKLRLEGKLRPKPLKYFIDRGASIVLRGKVRDDGLVEPEVLNDESDSDLVIIEIPKNFTEILKRDLSLANKWRLASRNVFTKYLEDGYIGFDFLRDSGRYYYVLWRGDINSILNGGYP